MRIAMTLKQTQAQAESIHSQYLRKLESGEITSPHFPLYAGRTYYTDPVVLGEGRQNAWAEAEDITGKDFSKRRSLIAGFKLETDGWGYPLNPFRRPWMPDGRGLLGGWGPNIAGDALITTEGPNGLEILLIQRQNGAWAMPGGFANGPEAPLVTATRELSEEVSVSMDTARNWLKTAQIIYQGYAPSARNTRNAWIETSVCHAHIPTSERDGISIKGADDAQAARWFPLNGQSIGELFEVHSHYVLMAAERLVGLGKLEQAEFRRMAERLGY